MSLGAYVLARFNDPEKLLPAMQKVQSCEPVQHWHAVDGHVHLVMKVRGNAASLPETLQRLDGLDRLLAYDIVSDGEHHGGDPSLAHAYVFLEIEPNKVESVCAGLKKMPEMLFCSTTRGGCDAVVLLQGVSFDALDYAIENNIRMLDGVLRLKRNYVIELTQL